MKENDENRQMFEYNLSAFLSAARSITSFWENRFGKKFRKWYFGKEQKDKTGILKLLRKMRNSNVHKKPINPRTEIKIEMPPIRVRVSAISVEAIVRNADGTIKDYEYSESHVEPKITHKQDYTEITESKWFFKNCPNQYRNVDVITLCKKYLNELKIIVEEAESKFSEANTS